MPLSLHVPVSVGRNGAVQCEGSPRWGVQVHALHGRLAVARPHLCREEPPSFADTLTASRRDEESNRRLPPVPRFQLSN